MVRPVRPSISWVSARGKAGSKNQCKPLKIRGSPKRTKASAAGATPVFHEISRAAGPKQQTTKTRKPIVCPTLAKDQRRPVQNHRDRHGGRSSCVRRHAVDQEFLSVGGDFVANGSPVTKDAR